VNIVDGRSRTVSFVTDGNGLILERDEVDNLSPPQNNPSLNGDPRELHYYFNGIRVGDVSNNGTSDVDYVASIGAHQASQGAGAFRNGSAYSSPYADFDQSYDPINGLTYQSTASRYTVQEGDTLEAIALRLWGDASFWYLIADANGLTGAEPLVAGQTLSIPNKVHNAHNTSDVYRVYDPNEAIGDTSPTAVAPAAKPKGNKCGIFGQILLLVIAVAVTALTRLPIAQALGGATPGVGATIAGGALAGAAGSIASQVVGVATGIQDKFSFKGVAMAAIGGTVSAGLGELGVFDKLGVGGTGFGARFAQGALSNGLTQGVGVATGLQKRFDVMGVAAAGLAAGVASVVGGAIGVDLRADTWKNDLLIGAANMAGGLVAAASRSLVEGTDFGDNIRSVLPAVIGNTVGGLLARGLQELARPEATKAAEDGGNLKNAREIDGFSGKVGDEYYVSRSSEAGPENGPAIPSRWVLQSLLEPIPGFTYFERHSNPFWNTYSYARYSSDAAAQIAADFSEGLIFGDFSNRNSGAAITGKIVGGFLPIADLRDIGAASLHIYQGREGAWTGLGLSVLGAVPVAGDWAKSSLKHGDEIVRHANDLADSVERSAFRGAYATNSDLVQSIATRADNWGIRKDMGNGPLVGIAKHGYAEELLNRYQRIFGDRGLTAEARYIGGAPWQSGMTTTGSIRLDVVEGPLTNPTRIWDYKFGQATLSPSRVTTIRDGIPNGANVPVMMVRP
jgi:hypothetical protein